MRNHIQKRLITNLTKKNQTQINNQKKTILTITSSYPIKAGDIQGTFVNTFVDCMVLQGYRMVVLTPFMTSSKFFEKREDLIIYRFPYFFPFRFHRLSTTGGMYFGFMNSFLGKIQIIPYLLMMILYAGVIIKKENVSLMHTHWIIPQGIIGAFWRRIYNIPHISTAYTLDITITKRIPFLSCFLRWVLHNIDCVTVISKYAQTQVLQFSPSSLPITIIPMGMDDNRISIVNPDEIVDKASHVILFVGRIIKWKGIGTLIQAMKEVKQDYPDVKLFIIGDGPDLNIFSEMVHSLELSDIIKFLGKLPDAELKIAYQKSDLFVLPSQPHNGIVMEGLGLVLLEAMASGVPVIGSNIGGITDIIEDGVNGLLIPPGDPSSLALAIKRIFKEPGLGKKFQINGLKTVEERFSWNILIKRYHELYQEQMKDF